MKFIKDIRHIIWDWNGTLVDDTQLCVDLINEILADHSLPAISIEAYQNTFDFPVIHYYRRLGFNLENVSFESLSDAFISGYIEARKKLSLHFGATKALQFFQEKNLPQCMLSASQVDALNQTLVEHDIDHYFKSVLGLGHHYANGKVHLGNQWLKENHIDTKHVLLIGDTLHDLEVANDMGIHCILVAQGHHSRHRLKAAHAYVTEDLNQLVRLFAACN